MVDVSDDRDILGRLSGYGSLKERGSGKANGLTRVFSRGTAKVLDMAGGSFAMTVIDADRRFPQT